MRIASWNINSVRLRLGLVLDFLKAEQPDVLCLQEIKVINELFPADAFHQLGYVHQAVHGQKGYHGVATLSRLPMRESHSENFCGIKECRHLQTHFENGVEVHNFYVPAGADIPDPDINPKFAHKLNFLKEMAHYFDRRPDKDRARAVLVGDLNVAPLENDVWSHKQMLRIISHTPVETNLLKQAQAAFDWVDVTRQFVPETEKIYSWWSYRAADWAASDRGRRLDHIWVSQSLKNNLSNHTIQRDARGWTQPSDHVPVTVTVTP